MYVMAAAPCPPPANLHQMECLKRNIGHLCTKDERQPRAKRAKVTPSIAGDESQTQVTDPNANPSTAQPKDSEAEEAAQILENYVDNATLERASYSVAPDTPNPYWSNPQRQVDQVSLLREIVHAMPEVDIIHLLHEVFLTRCQGPLGNVLHIPTFERQVGEFCDCFRLPLADETVMALLNKISMEMLSCHLMAVCISFSSHPAYTYIFAARNRARLPPGARYTGLVIDPSCTARGRAPRIGGAR